MPTLSRQGSFLTAGLVAALALWASAAPTVVYPLYASQWGLTTATTTAVFAVYPLVLVVTLIVFGNLSDSIGRRTTILIGLGLLFTGSLSFAFAADLSWVFVGRALMGAGVGFALSPATAAMVEFARDSSRASSATTAATAGGLTLAALVGGALVQYGPEPLHLTFWVLAVATALGIVLAWFLPRHVVDPSVTRWQPRWPMIPRNSRMPFSAGTLGVSAAYCLGAIYLALGAQIAHDLVGSPNVLLDGAVIGLSAVSIGVVAILGRAIPARTALVVGPLLATAGLSALVVAGLQHSLIAFLVSSVIGGAGYSLMFAGGLGLVTAGAPVHHRAMVLSAAYVIAYVLQAATALGLGRLVTSMGLQRAIEIGSPAVLLLGFAALLLTRLHRPPAPIATDPRPRLLERTHP